MDVQRHGCTHVIGPNQRIEESLERREPVVCDDFDPDVRFPWLPFPQIFPFVLYASRLFIFSLQHLRPFFLVPRVAFPAAPRPTQAASKPARRFSDVPSIASPSDPPSIGTKSIRTFALPRQVRTPPPSIVLCDPWTRTTPLSDPFPPASSPARGSE
eukprot:scaffold2122_cov318-Pavlova_lutheri.AAC.1